MSKFQEGDMALIIRCDSDPILVGRVAELIKYVPPYVEYETKNCIYYQDGFPGWHVKISEKVPLSSDDGTYDVDDEFVIAENRLMPLKDDSLDKEEVHEDSLSCVQN